MISLQPFSQMMAFYPNFTRTEQVLSKPAKNKENWNGVSEFIHKNPQQTPQPEDAGEEGELGAGKGGHGKLSCPQSVNIDL